MDFNAEMEAMARNARKKKHLQQHSQNQQIQQEASLLDTPVPTQAWPAM
jgi:hypothetical protein